MIAVSIHTHLLYTLRTDAPVDSAQESGDEALEKSFPDSGNGDLRAPVTGAKAMFTPQANRGLHAADHTREFQNSIQQDGAVQPGRRRW